MAAIYTRTGDRGDTALFGGSRVTKQSVRVEAYGTVDEANTVLGLAKSRLDDPDLVAEIQHIQQRMFTLGAELASDELGAAQLDNLVGAADIEALEALIDRCLEETGPPRNFVVPGRDEVSGSFHVARTVVRRAERRVLTAAETTPIRPEVVKYLNRLSDTVYAIGRVVEERHTRNQVESTIRRVLAEVLGSSGSAAGAGGGNLARLDLEVATRMATAAQAKASELGVPIVFAVVDAGGNPILLHRMDDSLMASIALAGDKAFTSAAFKAPTHELTERAKEHGDLYGVSGSSSGRICVFGGGYPVFVNGSIAGGIGVSGGTVEEDMVIADHAMSAAS
ncbi:cob(I)yrinic acid a,c-diamide adenosyltransferase [Propionibacteriaceae bacterium Y1923]|uniref:cob(I)yrinic acid a,c-diamide adenosyltransferase n=1 Tax=Aestuariimicrobium sp. Y1814 TaxID=3418742 RepID=UPI003C17DFA5